jgi:hypothetical protein
LLAPLATSIPNLARQKAEKDIGPELSISASVSPFAFKIIQALGVVKTEDAQAIGASNWIPK